MTVADILELYVGLVVDLGVMPYIYASLVATAAVGIAMKLRSV